MPSNPIQELSVAITQYMISTPIWRSIPENLFQRTVGMYYRVELIKIDMASRVYLAQSVAKGI